MSRSCSLFSAVYSGRLSLAPRKVSARAGFTIVELLVASAITLVVLGLMLQVTFSVLKTFDTVSGATSARTQASAVLDYLRRDFQSIVWKRDNNVWLIATIQRDQDTINGGEGDTDRDDAEWAPAGNLKPGLADPGDDWSSLRVAKAGTNDWIDLQEYRFGQAGVWLRFFTNQATSSNGDVAPIAVAYQIVRLKPRDNSEEFRYQLFRSVVRSGRTPSDPTEAYSVADAGYNLASNANGSYNKPYTPAADENDDFGDPGSLRAPDRDALLANNVIDFGVRFWRRVPPTPTDPLTMPSTIELLFPANTNSPPEPSANNLGFAVTALTPAELTAGTGIPLSHLTIENSSLPAANVSTGFPDFVDIFVRVLTDEGARLIEAFENGNIEALSDTGGTPTANERKAHWWRIAEEHSEVFTERIPLVARPL
jgi:hypothetical protein